VKPQAVAPLAPSLLTALCDAVGPTGASPLDPAVPAALWQRALVGPAADFLARPGKELRAAVVAAGWALAGAAPAAMPPHLPLVVELLHAGSLIVDDVEDDSDTRRGAPALHRQVGVPLAINTGSWMYFWALAELAGLGLDPAVEREAHRAAIAALVRCHQGQALDLATRIADLDAADVPAVVAATTRLKTGALCRLAAELGAIAAGAAPARRAAIAGFGEAMGVALQMLDDLGSITARSRRDKGREDLRAGRPTWPWAWLAEESRFAWARLAPQAREVAAGRGDPDALADALAEIVGPTGRDRVRAALDRVVADLRAAVGPGPAVDAVAAELARMEASYG